jgi:hypothetical protein
VDLGVRVARSCEIRTPSCLWSSYAPKRSGASSYGVGLARLLRRSLSATFAEFTFAASRRIGVRERTEILSSPGPAFRWDTLLYGRLPWEDATLRLPEDS